MVVLDTNVVSELMRASPTHEVVEWLDTQQTRDLFVTSVTAAEIRADMAVLPEGSRRRGLVAAAERAFGNLFAGRVLAFDSAAARAYAEIFATRQAAGRPLSLADGQIAAIARFEGDGGCHPKCRGLRGCGRRFGRSVGGGVSATMEPFRPRQDRRAAEGRGLEPDRRLERRFRVHAPMFAPPIELQER